MSRLRRVRRLRWNQGASPTQVDCLVSRASGPHTTTASRCWKMSSGSCDSMRLARVRGAARPCARTPLFSRLREAEYVRLEHPVVVDADVEAALLAPERGAGHAERALDVHGELDVVQAACRRARGHGEEGGRRRAQLAAERGVRDWLQLVHAADARLEALQLGGVQRGVDRVPVGAEPGLVPEVGALLLDCEGGHVGVLLGQREEDGLPDLCHE
eukprot:2807354-Rhodomonas_salina.1